MLEQVTGITLGDVIKTMIASVIVGAVTLYGTVRVLEAKMDTIQAKADAAYGLAHEIAMRQAAAIAERKSTDNHHTEALGKLEGRLDRIDADHGRMLRGIR